eukprot:1838140-Pleurochrysis_carterae.AAC.2
MFEAVKLAWRPSLLLPAPFVPHQQHSVVQSYLLSRSACSIYSPPSTEHGLFGETYSHVTGRVPPSSHARLRCTAINDSPHRSFASCASLLRR